LLQKLSQIPLSPGVRAANDEAAHEIAIPSAELRAVLKVGAQVGVDASLARDFNRLIDLRNQAGVSEWANAQQILNGFGAKHTEVTPALEKAVRQTFGNVMQFMLAHPSPP